MKDLLRQKLGINVEVMDLLNKQIADEAFASATYLAMASWCDQNGLKGSAGFFYRQAEEERGHQMKIFHFVNDNGGTAYSPQVKVAEHEYNSIQEIFELALENELAVTDSIHKIVKKCRKVEDFRTENFLQWFVSEQMEEEKTMRDILDICDLLADSPSATKLIDERIQLLAAK